MNSNGQGRSNLLTAGKLGQDGISQEFWDATLKRAWSLLMHGGAKTASGAIAGALFSFHDDYDEASTYEVLAWDFRRFARMNAAGLSLEEREASIYCFECWAKSHGVHLTEPGSLG